MSVAANNFDQQSLSIAVVGDLSHTELKSHLGQLHCKDFPPSFAFAVASNLSRHESTLMASRVVDKGPGLEPENIERLLWEGSGFTDSYDLNSEVTVGLWAA